MPDYEDDATIRVSVLGLLSRIDGRLDRIENNLVAKVDMDRMVALEGRVDTHLESPHASQAQHELRIRELEGFAATARGALAQHRDSRALLFSIIAATMSAGAVLASVLRLIHP